MTFQFNCGACGSTIRSSESVAGTISACPSCGAQIRIPMPKNAQDTVVEYGATTPSWFLPVVIWFFVACVGAMSGFVYGHWVRARRDHADVQITAPQDGPAEASPVTPAPSRPRGIWPDGSAPPLPRPREG